MTAIPEFTARMATPFAVLGIRTAGAQLLGIAYLPRQAAVLPPQTDFAGEVCRQVEAYLANFHFRFDLPFALSGTPHQCEVWRAIAAIPAGRTRSYGDLAAEIGSAPRAVGAACGANPLPLVIPCHRVVAKHGLGGFMGTGRGAPLEIKRWLLRHEGF
ncbi:MAG: methylated-DNA--[protein]-cysteine S-methyltransferase [Betaproteobacteria bacterium]|nr:methylated-DNA--[protein]-cysteine S-methyltransferase [Betaproteobacteria bacterium]